MDLYSLSRFCLQVLNECQVSVSCRKGFAPRLVLLETLSQFCESLFNEAILKCQCYFLVDATYYNFALSQQKTDSFIQLGFQRCILYRWAYMFSSASCWIGIFCRSVLHVLLQMTREEEGVTWAKRVELSNHRFGESQKVATLKIFSNFSISALKCNM